MAFAIMLGKIAIVLELESAQLSTARYRYVINAFKNLFNSWLGFCFAEIKFGKSAQPNLFMGRVTQYQT